jgi:hypothetical protein
MLAWFSLLLITLIKHSAQAEFTCVHFSNIKYSPCLGHFESTSTRFEKLTIVDTESLRLNHISYDHINIKTELASDKTFTETWSIEKDADWDIPIAYNMELNKDQINYLHLTNFNAILNRLESNKWRGDESIYQLHAFEEDSQKEKALIARVNKILKAMFAFCRKVQEEGASEEIKGYIGKIVGVTELDVIEKSFEGMNLEYKDKGGDYLALEVKYMMGVISKSFQNVIIQQLNLTFGVRERNTYIRYVSLKDE